MTSKAEADGVVWDEKVQGLGRRVQAGKISWIVRYRVAGVQRQKTLPGSLKEADARRQATAIRAAAVEGKDRVAEGRETAAAKRAQERAERDRERRGLKKLVELYVADAEQKLRPATMRETKRYLEVALKPLHDHDAEELQVRTVAGVLAEVAKERGRTSANRARAYLSACLSYGVSIGMLERNVLIGTKRPQPERRRDRVLSEDELRMVLQEAGTSDDFGVILRLLALLGQRREEVAAMRWSELELDRALWHLPGSRTKNHRPHDVPLPRQAVALLEARLPADDSDARDLVFGRREGGFSGWSKCRALLDDRISRRRAEARLGRKLAEGEAPEDDDAMPSWVVHDLRRGTVTGMAEIGIEPHIIESVVNHMSGHKGGIAGVYNRAQYTKEKTIALQRWADHVDRIMAGALDENVVAFVR